MSDSTAQNIPGAAYSEPLGDGEQTAPPARKIQWDDPNQPIEQKSAGFLDENPGEKSGMRLFCFMTVATILGVYAVSNIYVDALTAYQMKRMLASGQGSVCDLIKNIKLLDFPPYTLYALILAIFGKLAQKLLEETKDVLVALTAFKQASQNQEKPQE